MVTSSDSKLHKAILLQQQGQLKKADTLYSKILAREPSHIEALHMRGVLKIQDNKLAHARELLNKAARLSPESAWIFFHRGELCQTLTEHSEAELHLKKALALGAVDADVHFTLGNALFDQSRFNEASESYKTALQLSPSDHDFRLNLANSLEAQGQLDQAVEHLTLLTTETDAPASVRLQLVSVLARYGDFTQAEQQIQTLAMLTAEDAPSLIESSNTLLAADRTELASRLLDLAFTQGILSPDNANLSISMSEKLNGLLINLGRYSDARPQLSVNQTQRSAIAWFQQGLCEQAAGSFAQAAQSHRQALAIDETLGRAAYSLAANGQAQVSETDIDNWQKQANNTHLSTEQRSQFVFSVARVQDKAQQFDEAFATYTAANTLHKSANPFDPDAWDQYIDSIIINFSTRYFERLKDIGCGGENLVFIVGMPRSGSTLLEQKLIQHMDVCGLGEHPTIRRLFMDLPRITERQLPVAECAEYINEAQIKYMRNQYRQSLPSPLSTNALATEPDDKSESSIIFVDKMLGNFLRLGIIAAMFPEAKILHCTRDSTANCVSCYTNLFARGLRFTYDLYGLGRAWKSYDRLMQHWRDVLPLRVYDVAYERLVSEPEVTFKDIASFLGSSCSPDVTPVTTASTDINTASFFQARQAISTSSITAWKRFDAHLEPLYRGLS